VKWLVILTRLVDYGAYEPILELIDAENLDALREKLDELERNDMEITAIPLISIIHFLHKLCLKELT